MIRAATLPLVLAVAGIAACEPPIPADVVVSPSLAKADIVGETVQYTAQVIDDQGDPIVGAEVTWSSASPEVATVSASGLATVTGQGTASIRAAHLSVSGSGTLAVELTPARLAKVAGDAQTAPALSVLPQNPTVRVEDGGGAPIPDVPVAFAVTAGDGQVTPRNATTNSSGEAFARWTLGEPTGPQLLAAAAGGLFADFTATATSPLLAVRPARLGRPRIGVAYRDSLEAIGGTPPFSWSLADGSLPSGLMLDTAGIISGTATAEGSSTFTVRVRDAAGIEASRALDLRACEAPLDLEAGDVLVVDPVGASACPPFLPAGQEGDRYRVGVVRTAASVDANYRVSVVVTVTETGAGAGPAPRATPLSWVRPVPELHPALVEGLRLEDASARLHATLSAQVERLIRELGREALLPDTRNGVARGALATDRQVPPADRMLFRPYDAERSNSACESPAPVPVPAFLVDYNDHLAIYQDSAQQVADPVDTPDARQVLDYFEAYGAETVDGYFGGVSDINGDQRVNVFVSPVVGDGIAAFVWGADFLNAADCSWSNQMELIYFHEAMFDALRAPPADRHYQALATMVHEMKHVSSLYRRSLAGGRQPSWVEEGTAELAGEVSSRKAMAAVGGVARGASLARDAYPARDGSIITPENYGVLLRLARVILSYTEANNSLTTNPTQRHTYYGTSWHFHRFLGDAYGDAADEADGPFFTTLNDTATAPGPAGMQQVTGKSIQLLLEEYTAAMMLNGTGAPESDRVFRTYDFPSATSELFRPGSQPEGLYPWPRTGPTPAGFESGSYAGNLAPAGIRFHDFESDGIGDGIEVEVSVTGGGPVRVVIVRVR